MIKSTGRQNFRRKIKLFISVVFVFAIILGLFIDNQHSSRLNAIGHRTLKGEKILTASMEKYGNNTSILSDPNVDVTGFMRVIFRPSKSMTVQFDLEGLSQSLVCRCCFISISHGSSCDNAIGIGTHHYFNSSSVSNPWTKLENFPCYSLSGNSGTSMGSFGLFTGFGYDENKGHPIIVKDFAGNVIGCGVLD